MGPLMYTCACVACEGRTGYAYGVPKNVISRALGLAPQPWERAPLCYDCWRSSGTYFRTVQKVLWRLEDRGYIVVGSEKADL